MIINSNPAKYLSAWATRNAVAAYRELQEKTMTNAIEQTRREMYESFIGVKAYSGCKALVDLFETRLEAHLEALRKDTQRSNSEQDDLSIRLAKMTTERDTLRNRIQAFEMASQTSAEIIKGLREELNRFRSVSGSSEATSAQDSKENASSAKTDPYTLGYSSVGKCSNPFPVNTAERLHWNDGFKDAQLAEQNQKVEVCSHTLTSYGRCTKCLELFPVGGVMLIHE